MKSPRSPLDSIVALLRRAPKDVPAVGTTPHTVVWTENKWRLLRFVSPTGARPRFKTPVLLVPSLINRWYVLDLGPGRSLIEWLVAQGHDVFCIDWGTPGPKFVDAVNKEFTKLHPNIRVKRVTQAFKIILTNKNVKAILVNIFGGIVRCDTIAEGVITAVREVHVGVPVVVRLEGTNVEKGREMLAASGLKVVAATGLTDAASKVVQLAGAA